MKPLLGPVRQITSVGGHIVRSFVATNELLAQRRRALLDLEHALPSTDAFDEQSARLDELVTTPDFHPGKPVPVGVVADVTGAILPHLIGSDIGCGMRMLVIEDLTVEELIPIVPELTRHLRAIYFQGKRDIALDGMSRFALLRDGLPGLLDAIGRPTVGLLGRSDPSQWWRDLDRTADAGSFAAGGIDPEFRRFATEDRELRWDGILGTIGGGNHFVEIGSVTELSSGGDARLYGARKGAITIVIHSGSLDFGQSAFATAKDAQQRARSVSDPRIVPFAGDREAEALRYVRGMRNAANAAFGNRFLLGLCALEAIRQSLGREVDARLVYDSPHNLAWTDGQTTRHRKGACPAGMPTDGPFAGVGEPVIVPGSMGDATWLLAGTGSVEALSSCAHGAGRRLSRQEARSEGRILPALRVVGPVDLGSLQGRPDVRREAEARLAEEAPCAYRKVEDVVSPLVEAGAVRRVAKIAPFLTVKG